MSLESCVFSVEILDHIFSFLASDWKTLMPCSKDPILGQISDRHLYHHVIIFVGSFYKPTCCFTPDEFSDIISDNPRILNHARTLQIEHGRASPLMDLVEIHRLSTFASTLVMFSALESILLSISNEYWPDDFRAALQDRFENLPLLKKLKLAWGANFPLSVLHNCNIDTLSMDVHVDHQHVCCDSSLLQLKSLAIRVHYISPNSPIIAWLKLHTNDLRSLQFELPSGVALSDLFRTCSRTLNKLDLRVNYSTICASVLPFLSQIFSLLPTLQHLTIRMLFQLNFGQTLRNATHLDLVASIIPKLKTLSHLVLEIHLNYTSEADTDFAPNLAILGEASQFIPRVDLYYRVTRYFSSDETHDLMSPLSSWIPKGKLVIHPGETAPYMM